MSKKYEYKVKKNYFSKSNSYLNSSSLDKLYSSMEEDIQTFLNNNWELVSKDVQVINLDSGIKCYYHLMFRREKIEEDTEKKISIENS